MIWVSPMLPKFTYWESLTPEPLLTDWSRGASLLKGSTNSVIVLSGSRTTYPSHHRDTLCVPPLYYVAFHATYQINHNPNKIVKVIGKNGITVIACNTCIITIPKKIHIIHIPSLLWNDPFLYHSGPDCMKSASSGFL